MVGSPNSLQQPIKKGAFLDNYAETGNITTASKVAGINRCTHYEWMEQSEDYEIAFTEAQQVYLEKLEAECDRRGVEGWDEPVFYEGEECGSKRRHSDICLLFRMKRLDPSYRDGPQVVNQQNVQVNMGDDERRARIKAMILAAQEVAE